MSSYSQVAATHCIANIL